MMVDRVRRTWRNAVAAGVLLLVAVLAVLVFNAINNLGDRLQSAETDRDTLTAQNDGLRRDVQTLSGQVRKLGGTPAVTPAPGPIGSPGKTGAAGRPGRPPTQAQIAAAVSAYLREHPPAPGRPPTMAEILTAVTGYLAQHPPAAGPSGAPGKDGTDGKDGQDGASGPPPTDEQVRAAVETYLAAHPLNCPAGTHFETFTVVTTSGPQEAVLCVKD